MYATARHWHLTSKEWLRRVNCIKWAWGQFTEWVRILWNGKDAKDLLPGTQRPTFKSSSVTRFQISTRRQTPRILPGPTRTRLSKAWSRLRNLCANLKTMRRFISIGRSFIIAVSDAPWKWSPLLIKQRWWMNVRLLYPSCSLMRAVILKPDHTDLISQQSLFHQGFIQVKRQLPSSLMASGNSWQTKTASKLDSSVSASYSKLCLC